MRLTEKVKMLSTLDDEIANLVKDEDVWERILIEIGNNAEQKIKNLKKEYKQRTMGKLEGEEGLQILQRVR